MSSPSTLPSQEINGAVESSTAASLHPSVSPSSTTPPAAPAPITPSRKKHQIDGSYIPLTGPITSVHQLTRRQGAIAGSIGSFETLAAYTEHLRGMTLAQLHVHAVEEAHVVPIDDESRLIRRLENNWTEVNARERGRQGKALPVQGQRFTDEQLAKQAAIRKRMLSPRG